MTQTGQGPYDGSDDTLIGVVNSSSLPIYSLTLSSSLDIFGFDGDGIDTYGIQGNAQDNTGYGGPNAYFTNISTDETGGTVNFIVPIPPGGTAYFSLENILSASQACTNLLNNSVPSPTVSNQFISTSFTPQGTDPNTGQPYTLAAAGLACGFIGFDWQQTITTLPTPLPGTAFNAIATPSTPPATPFNDPPPSGYNYMLPVPPGPLDAPQLPVYWDPFNGPYDADPKGNGSFALAYHTNTATSTVTWSDAPKDVCLPGMQAAQIAAFADTICGGPGVRAPAGSTINFTTHLIGLQGALPGAAVVDTGVGFTWNSNFNGTDGGTMVTSLSLPSLAPADPTTGTGGFTVTSYSPLSTYNGTAVTAVNGSSGFFSPSPLLAAVLPESRTAQPGGTISAFATIINTGATAATGCSIAPVNALPGTFVYQTTDPITNALTGTPNTPVTIAGNNGSQSFVVGFTPSAEMDPSNVGFNFACTNASPAPIYAGLNTLLLSAPTLPAPDVVALAATAQNDGIVHVTGAGSSGSFAVATDNLGSADTITVGTNTGGSTLPLTITICQTNPTSGQCLTPPAATVSAQIATNATLTFAIFATASGTIAFNPASSRVFVTFTDSSNTIRGQTSVAVETQ